MGSEDCFCGTTDSPGQSSTKQKIPTPTGFRTVFLKLVILPPSPGDIWRCLQTFSVVVTGGGGVTGIHLIETGDAVKFPQCTSGPTARIIVAIGLRLRNRSSRTAGGRSCCGSNSEVISAPGECTTLGICRRCKGFAGRGS